MAAAPWALRSWGLGPLSVIGSVGAAAQQRPGEVETLPGRSTGLHLYLYRETHVASLM